MKRTTEKKFYERRKTTCNNYECPNCLSCNVNIWKESYVLRKCPTGFDYQSQKARIYIDYCKKEEAAGRKPDTYMGYFEEW